MGLLDSLSRPIAGQQYAQGPMPNGNAGVPMPSGMTYGNILQAALQYGSKPGSSGPMIGGMVGQKYGGQPGQGAMNGMPAQGAVTNALQPLAEQPGSIMPPKQQGSGNSIWSMLAAYLGL